MGLSPKRKGGPLSRPPAKRTTASSKAGPVLASRHRSDIKAVYDAYNGLYGADTAPASVLDGNFQRVLDGATGKPHRLDNSSPPIPDAPTNIPPPTHHTHTPHHHHPHPKHPPAILARSSSFELEHTLLPLA